MSLPLLTASRLSTARSCQRKHKLRYVDGYRPVAEVSALKFGSLTHGALEMWWRAYAVGRDPFEAAQTFIDVQKGVDPFDAVRVSELMRGYTLRWADQDFEVLGIEKEFRTDLINPDTKSLSRTWGLGGKIDVIVKDRKTGLVHIIEHKTSSVDIGPGSTYWRLLKMDGQVSIYFDGATSLGHDVASCIYDVIAKPGIRPLQVSSKRSTPETPEEFRIRLQANIAEDPNGYYQRGEVVRIGSELDDSRADIWQLGQQIRESERTHRAPRNPDACGGGQYHTMCPYFDVCTGSADIQDQTLFKKITNVHPELSEEANNASRVSPEANPSSPTPTPANDNRQRV